ncbi:MULTISPECIES: hypothetical protein [unclassified Nonomuraea]|uniref:hypothetical protein n=1 Tax=unclassified Nonomuraea TaxID=2593643 RepID=UPI0033D006B0
MRKIVALLGVAAMATGCGLVPPPPPAPGLLGRQQQVMAACMKGRGFAYAPAVPGTPAPPAADEQRRRDGDQAAMRAYRSRYGYGVFAALARPNDPLAHVPETLPPQADLPAAGTPATSPSAPAATSDATPTRTHMPEPPAIGTPVAVEPPPAAAEPAGTRAAGTRADGGAATDAYAAAGSECFVITVKQTLGRDVTDAAHLRRQYVRALGRAWKNELDTDPGLIALAGSYASCLTAKGYEVAATAPTEVATSERDRFAALLKRLEKSAARHREGKRVQRRSPADVSDESRQVLPAREAERYLRREIASALDDLECGGRFFAVYRPRQEAVAERLAATWGLVQ